jgi:hypothetical protein
MAAGNTELAYTWVQIDLAISLTVMIAMSLVTGGPIKRRPVPDATMRGGL